MTPRDPKLAPIWSVLVRGALVLSAAVALQCSFPNWVSAQLHECGSDRRCRLERLRAVRWHAAKARAQRRHRRHQSLLAEIRAAEIRRTPRLRKMFAAETVVSDLRAGATLGMHPLKQFYVGVGFARRYDQSSYDGDVVRDFSEIYTVSVQLRYLFLSGVFSPYLGAGFHVSFGGISMETLTFFGEAWRDAGYLVAHQGSVDAGLELQFGFGLRIRLGAVLRPLAYVRASRFEAANELMHDVYRDHWSLFGVEGAVGWAF